MASEQKPKVVLCKNITNEGTLCNAEIQITFKFCDECGIKITKEMFEVVVMVCPDCNREVPAGKKFCSDCGKNVIEKEHQPTNVKTTNVPDSTILSVVGPCGDRKVPERCDPPPSLPLVAKELDSTVQISVESKSESVSDKSECHVHENETESRIEDPDSNTSKDSGLGLDKDIAVSDINERYGKNKETSDTTAMDESPETESCNVPDTLNRNGEKSEENLTDRSSKDLAEHFDTVSLDSPLPVQTNLNQNDTVNDSSDEEESDSGDEHSIDYDVRSQPNKTDDSETPNGRKRKKTTGKKEYKKKRAKKRDKQADKEKKKNELEKIVNAGASDKTGKGDEIMPHPLMEVSLDDKVGIPEQNTDSSNTIKSGVKDHTETNGTVGVQDSSKEEMVFGALRNEKTCTVETTVQEFEPKGPKPSGSLFEIGCLYGKSNEATQDEREEVTPQKSNEANKNAAPAQATGKTATTHTQASPGPKTRSKTQQDKQNNQKKEAALGKNASSQAKGKDNYQKQTNIRTERRVMQVHFVALISEEFKINTNTDKVFIRGYVDKESDWSTTKHEMKFTGYVLLKC